MKYAYPALIREDGNVYSVYFPDIGRGGTTGNDIPDALHLANDWLAGTLYDYAMIFYWLYKEIMNMKR